MYIHCKDGNTQYIIDTEEKQVYELLDDCAILLDIGADNFMRWHPYLEEIETTTTKPREINKNNY